jgi:hypothetical protein
MIFDRLISIMRGAGIEDNIETHVECMIVDRACVFFRQSTGREESDAGMILQVLVTGINERLNVRWRRIFQLEEHDMRQLLTDSHGRPFLLIALKLKTAGTPKQHPPPAGKYDIKARRFNRSCSCTSAPIIRDQGYGALIE